ncbi:LOW QUALITY PROTEIN: proto-oncogene tyrosine-protein kinase receptor Ret-like [Haliotis rubra]|uniref:LOW QUALITY PROTEIN: proto-oncogene tyrosine-protein kinase receptor Ret-like n=1 Tax=Haliotis rubra TaxID=36100 RepID=UPI001EE57830|nr:LOW QUALITY PROTEIN: proto-oncogene tyrosine-protein kinase receptor Ret-like [Haliotis rubra]
MCRLWTYLFITFLCKGIWGLYFPQRMYRFTLPPGAPHNTIIGRVFVLNNVTSYCDEHSIKYVMYWAHDYTGEVSRLVDIDHVSGEVKVIGVSEETRSKENTMDLRVNASCIDRLGQQEVASVQVQIHVSSDGSIDVASDPGQRFEKLCWEEKDPEFMVQEGLASATFAALRFLPDIGRDIAIIYTLDDASPAPPYFTINNVTSEMSLKQPLDREENEAVSTNVTCTVKSGSQEIGKTSTTVTVNVIGVNDNPLLFITDSSQLTVKDITDDTKSISEMLQEGDKGQPEQYDVTVVNDTQRLVGTVKLDVHNTPSGRFLLITVVPNITKDVESPYSVDIHVRDRGFQPQLSSTANSSDTAIVRLNYKRHVPYVKMRLNRNAAKYYRLGTLSALPELRNASINHYSIHNAINSSVPLAVTPRKGIVYVVDDRSLQKFHANVFTVDVHARTDGGEIIVKTIQVSLHGDVGRELGTCDEGCSQYMNMSSCENNCGLGTADRRCRWRPGYTNMSRLYSTCTFFWRTCPDRVCDELEQLNAYLCPQDCTKESIIGETRPTTGRGIGMAKGPCWCDGRPVKCHCMGGPATRRHPHREGHSRCWYSCRATSRRHRILRQYVQGICCFIRRLCSGSHCRQCCHLAGLASTSCRRSQVLKHVGSIVSMTALPSDYLEDREPRTSYHTNPSPQWSPKVNTVPPVNNDIRVNKWEFPREHLHLQQTLGEGEFGQVVQAIAWAIYGDDKYATVAVKMLKTDATVAEYQDLWSELNLLKEVNHPNVIRLLGACTQNGPFYVIVEYCKHGCLKSYLRSSRFKDRKSWDANQNSGNSEPSRNEQAIVLVIRDLLSFSWQIAKGMEYLSNMKFVHRDLAARNVLVGEGRVLKISDFGLSRDVYEADAYLKMTKGRIPVKWMAPESLYAQIYTTKSDIWSFGILLWEMTTLGANPYPGIAPERLFSLLRSGYRMDRPDDCPEEVYAIMQKCWKAEPEDRPTFHKLADILDTMLQQREGYLDLTDDTAYMEDRLNYLDSTDWRGEWSDYEEGYGSITVLRQTGDNYLTAMSCGEGETDAGEEGKLLPPSPKDKDILKHVDNKNVSNTNREEDIWLLKNSKPDVNKGKRWRDNAYEIHCV